MRDRGRDGGQGHDGIKNHAGVSKLFHDGKYMFLETNFAERWRRVAERVAEIAERHPGKIEVEQIDSRCRRPSRRPTRRPRRWWRCCSRRGTRVTEIFREAFPRHSAPATILESPRRGRGERRRDSSSRLRRKSMPAPASTVRGNGSASSLNMIFLPRWRTANPTESGDCSKRLSSPRSALQVCAEAVSICSRIHPRRHASGKPVVQAVGRTTNAYAASWSVNEPVLVSSSARRVNASVFNVAADKPSAPDCSGRTNAPKS